MDCRCCGGIASDDQCLDAMLITQLLGNGKAAVIDERITPLPVRGIGTVGQVNEALVWQLCLKRLQDAQATDAARITKE